MKTAEDLAIRNLSTAEPLIFETIDQLRAWLPILVETGTIAINEVLVDSSHVGWYKVSLDTRLGLSKPGTGPSKGDIVRVFEDDMRALGFGDKYKYERKEK